MRPITTSVPITLIVVDRPWRTPIPTKTACIVYKKDRFPLNGEGLTVPPDWLVGWFSVVGTGKYVETYQERRSIQATRNLVGIDDTYS